MSADNDIVESLLIWKTGPVLREHPGFFLVPETDIDKVAAEIGRLRGEVEARISPDWVIGYFPADVAEEVKRAVRDAFGEWNALSPKPAPAMPNGLEGLIQNFLDKEVHPTVRDWENRNLAGISILKHWRDFLISLTHAADNRDAAVPAGEAVAIPGPLPMAPRGNDQPEWDHDSENSYVQGWNDCRSAALAAHPPAAQVQASPQEGEGYYLASFKHKANNGEVMWWKGDNAGYSPDLEQAGIYTELVPGYHDSEDTVPVPVAFLAGLRVRRTVDPGDSLNHMFWSAKTLRAALQHRGDSRGGEE